MSAEDKYSLQERGRFKAWWDAARPLEGSAFPYEIAWAAWQAALSAQPSPGGQGDGDLSALAASIGEVAHRLSTYMPHLSEWADRARDCKRAAEVLSALAARQPVGEPAMYQVRPRRFPAGEGWREVSKREFDDRGDFPGYPEAEWERRALYTAPPAQAVDLGLQLDRYDAGLLGNGGGGDVNWWQDYIRAELDRAHEFYQEQADAHG